LNEKETIISEKQNQPRTYVSTRIGSFFCDKRFKKTEERRGAQPD